jgi:catechol 2,3-dioxygenase-like lactoylglutathione lyase family enzyme
MSITLSHLDHFVLTVPDIDRTCDFYVKVLGMERMEFGAGRTALKFGQQKINLHPTDKILDPHVKHALPGSEDLCFITKTPIADVLEHLKACGVSPHLGPVERSGSQGPIMSVYFYDPDENQIEVSNQL